MRPRHKAAENHEHREQIDIRLVASMRPRHKAAENACPRASTPWRSGRFNEAAA